MLRGAGDAVALERDGRAERWIEQLGHRDYPMREEAQAELLRLGPGALEALETAAEQGDLEVAARARYLLRLIQWEWLAKLGPEEIAQQLKDYRDLDGASRLARIRQFGAARREGCGCALPAGPLRGFRAALEVRRHGGPPASTDGSGSGGAIGRRRAGAPGHDAARGSALAAHLAGGGGSGGLASGVAAASR